jgi:hypothetical protein
MNSRVSYFKTHLHILSNFYKSNKVVTDFSEMIFHPQIFRVTYIYREHANLFPQKLSI